MADTTQKFLDSVGLAYVNEVFNERLSELGGGSGGIDWDTTPYTNMNFMNTSNVFFSVILCTERRNATLRYVRSTVIAHVKSDSYAGSSQLLMTLPGDFPDLTFTAVSSDIPQMTGTGTLGMEMSGTGSKVSLRLNPAKAAVASGLYIGCVTTTVVG